MYNITVKDIIEQCSGKIIMGDINKECIDFSTDTRKIKQGDVYIGLKGEKFDGSQFYKQALQSGASACILQNIEIDNETKENYKDRTIIIVEDTLKTLQKLAKYKRSKYNIPVIAITGSVGKTSTKDIIASVVATKYNVLKTEGNFNNHIGLPLTILRLKDHDAMVVEMGMNNLGEISLLTDIAKPTIAVITNVGTAHIGNLGSRENILKAKLEILEGLSQDGTLIINNDNDMLHMWNEKNDIYKVLDFGIENNSKLMAKDIKINSTSSQYKIIDKNEEINIEVPIASKVFIYNSLSAICVGKTLNIEINKIIEGIKNFELSKNRMEVTTINKVTIINDCYNANFDSMKASIESLAKMEGSRKIAILGDMLELGEFSQKLHSDIGKEICNNNIDILITVGEESKNIAQNAIENGMNKNNIYVLNNNTEVINLITKIKQINDTILIKASNGMHFIEIVNELKVLLNKK
ncbi:MAG: UDP-N-acetylmuramoyl-tripeptide--D-alanyl-D-alanine ligase [Clostridia bacterium]|nr:UDP-N-acetylmuramoyl-tripeptide--D-alanyl-D-alanine ligase [Clostridia bacterium]